jgi:hypothetical protein
VLYEVREVALPPVVTTAALWLMKIAPDYAITTTQVTTTNTNTNLFPGRILPDDHGGVAATWTFSPAQPPADPNPPRAAYVSAGGSVTEYMPPLQPPGVLMGTDGLPINPLLALGENDTAFVSYGSGLAAFNTQAGGIGWSYSAGVSPVAIVIADGATGSTRK